MQFRTGHNGRVVSVFTLSMIDAGFDWLHGRVVSVPTLRMVDAGWAGFQ